MISVTTITMGALLGAVAPIAHAGDDPAALVRARENGTDSQRAVQFCTRYAFGWLTYSDPKTGLLWRTVDQPFWNAQDCAADNFPFLALTAELTAHPTLLRVSREILATEQRLTNRLGKLPDDYDFTKQGFRHAEVDLGRLVFGASEYAKDGLMPWSEWSGSGPWLVRMRELVDGVFAHAAPDPGALPSDNFEVNGELLQTSSRLYWITGDPKYREFAFRLADHYFLVEDMLTWPRISLRDHGCEILGGLSEAYVIAAEEDPERHQRWQERFHPILDRILECGRSPGGLLYDAIDPAKGVALTDALSDGFGYVYDSVLTVGLVDDVPRYRDAVAHCLSNLEPIVCGATRGMGGADGAADSIEGAITLLRHLPDESAGRWVDREMDALMKFQRGDGILEGWYGDGNSARTTWMWALWKTQGAHLKPWRADLRLGAAVDESGDLWLSLKTDWPYQGTLALDGRRHREFLHLPLDYPRINQFPEWWCVDRAAQYEVVRDGGEPVVLEGKALKRYSISVPRGGEAVLRIRKLATGAERRDRYRSQDAPSAASWRRRLRQEFGELLALDASRQEIPLEAKLETASESDGVRRESLTLATTAATRIPVRLERPTDATGRLPAVVCIHGHGGNRDSVFDPASLYRGFATALVERGFLVISCDVGQHHVRESDRTLMGERLQDLLRCVDYLEIRDDVDPERIGCAGLSLGGEMAMWLCAMDPRIRATVSSGFLTTMDQMEEHHCMCWKFDGLRERVDYADLYAMAAPRALQCQNGLGEGPRDFNVTLARRALHEIQPAYDDLDATANLELHVHPGGHIVDTEACVRFLGEHLAVR